MSLLSQLQQAKTIEAAAPVAAESPVKARIVNGQLVVTTPIHEPAPSSTGKMLLFASAKSKTTEKVQEQTVSVSLVVGVYPQQKPGAKPNTAIQVKVNPDETMTITAPMTDPTPSSTGKTLSVASSHGFKNTTCQLPDGRLVVVNLNAYIYPKG